MVPFLGLAIIETLSGHRTDVIDPTLDIFVPQQPGRSRSPSSGR
ncbi:hypothetical protein ACFSTI_01015 [Rhizorhabdus histidinilytica]